MTKKSIFLLLVVVILLVTGCAKDIPTVVEEKLVAEPVVPEEPVAEVIIPDEPVAEVIIPDEPESQPTDLTIKDNKFDKETLSVKVGDTVTIKNMDNGIHAIFINLARVREKIYPGESFSYTFEAPGEYTLIEVSFVVSVKITVSGDVPVVQEPVAEPEETTVTEEPELAPTTTLEMCGRRDKFVLEILPLLTSATMCKSDTLIFDVASLYLRDVTPTSVSALFDGKLYTFSMGEHMTLPTSDGEVELWFVYGDGKVQANIKRLTNPKGFPDKSEISS